jgi:hypothetical protein
MNAANYTRVIATRTMKDDLVTPFSSLIGEFVVLIVNIRQCHVPLRCRIMDESLGEVVINIEPGWEMNVRKELILAVEQDHVVGNGRIN